MLKNFLCLDTTVTVLLVVDALFILAAVGLFVWYFVRHRQKNEVPRSANKPISKVDDETYVIENDDVPVAEPAVYEDDNEVVHFVNQITDINEEANTEFNTNSVVVNHEVEQPAPKIVSKDEIENFVMIDGQKKSKVETSKTVNRGTNAFQNATDFLNTINSEQADDALSSKKVTKKK